MLSSVPRRRVGQLLIYPDYSALPVCAKCGSLENWLWRRDEMEHGIDSRFGRPLTTTEAAIAVSADSVTP